MPHVPHALRTCITIGGVALLGTGCSMHGASSAVPPLPIGAHIGGMPAFSAQPATAGVPAHLLTAEYFSDSTRLPASWSTMAHMLDWVWVSGAQSIGAHAAGIHTILYTNPNRQTRGGDMWTDDESTFAHDCYGHRIPTPKHPGFYLMNPASTHLHDLWRHAVGAVSGEFDAIFEDNAVTVKGEAASLPCGFSQAAWDAATNIMDTFLGQPILWNSNLGRCDDGKASPALGLALDPTSVGGTTEGCYSGVDLASTKPRGYAWRAQENTELQLGWAGKKWFCRSDSTASAPSAIDLRTYYIASFLLTYDVHTSVLSEHFPTSDGFEVLPESKLVALNPARPQPSDVAGLELSKDVYGREYDACYVGGSPVGACAVVINIDGSSQAHPFPWPGKYSHTLKLSGGSLLSGGTIAANGPKPPASIQGDDALVVFK